MSPSESRSMLVLGGSSINVAARPRRVLVDGAAVGFTWRRATRQLAVSLVQGRRNRTAVAIAL